MPRPARARINLSALEQNLKLARQLAPRSEVVAVVKADAYGHGLVEVAGHLKEVPLAVACVDEAMVLRDAGINNPVLVLEGAFDQQCTEMACQYGLGLVVHDRRQLEWLQQLSSPADRSRPISIWLKLDSGMHRLGLDSDACVEVCQQIMAISGARLVGLMTHFACADELDSPHVLQQIGVFDACYRALPVSNLLRSTANSATLMQYPQAQYDQVRPGIMLYGSTPVTGKTAQQLGLQPVMSLESAIMSIHKLNIGESVGYGATWRAERESQIAQVAIGYGDGYPRHIKEGTCVAVNGLRAPIVGRVSMDMLSVDVSDIPLPQIGDTVELWGNIISVDEVACHAGTIGYELLTGVTSRVPRIYDPAS